jgi:hypothetical protein
MAGGRERVRESCGFFVGGFGGGKFFAGEGFEFAADEVGGEAGGEERAIDGGEFFVGFLFHFRACKYKLRTPTHRAEFAFDTLANDGGFRFRVGRFRESNVDVAVGNAASAEIAGDTEFALLADFRASAGELFGVARVVELAGLLEAREDDLSEEFGVGAAEKLGLHFVDGVGTAHEDAEGIIV